MSETFTPELTFGPWQSGIGLESTTNMQRRLIQAATAGGTFTPANLGANLFGWWTADQPSTVNTGSSNVWTPYAGTAGALTQATASNRGTYTSGVKMTFDATDWLDLAGAPASYDAIAVIITLNSNATFRDLFWNSTSNHSLIFNTGVDTFGTFQAAFTSSGLSVAVSTAAIIHLRMDASGNASYSLNGGTITGTILNFTAGNRAISSIANPSGAAAFAFGDVNAICITAAVLTQSDLDKTIGSLAWEWGLVSLLPGGHPYKTVHP